MSSKIEQLHQFLLNHFDRLDYSGGGGTFFDLPDYGLYADDYLLFAEENISRYKSTENAKLQISETIACVSNLKRALDVQIECFLHAYGLLQEVKKKNLSFRRKLKFMRNIGVFSSRTVDRLGSLRNKIEHEFEKPSVSDLDSLFDIATALVALAKNATSARKNIDYEGVIEYDEKHIIGDLEALYIQDNLKIKFHYRLFKRPISIKQNKEETDIPTRRKLFDPLEEGILEVSFEELSSFEYFLRCLFILYSFDTLGSSDHVKSLLEPNAEQVAGGNATR